MSEPVSVEDALNQLLDAAESGYATGVEVASAEVILRAAIAREKAEAVAGAFTEAMIAASDAVPPEAFDNRDIRVATICVKAIRQRQIAATAEKEAADA